MWDDLIDDKSTGSAVCSLCPEFRPEGMGREGIFAMIDAVRGHYERGTGHYISVDIQL